jgi:predicted phage baseplate assembly protein
MTLPAPNLDDLRFQTDLVDEARKRIVHYCPEWTEYNLSDPGITLIELFSWMTEMMVYRLNRVPEKNYLKFLEMLGLQRKPASSARTEITFWLSAPLPLIPEDEMRVIVPEGMEVHSEQTDDAVQFTTSRTLEIVPPLLTNVRKETEFNRNYLPRLQQGLETFYAFDTQKPRMGDTFYLGFDPRNNLSGHILMLNFSCDPTEAVGIQRDDPPWAWEYMNQQGEWERVYPSTVEEEKDTTGGLNNEQGKLVLYLPLTAAPGQVRGLEAFWIRCRVAPRNPDHGMYSESPRVKKVEAFSLGATVPAMHSVLAENERLGESNGEPGQSFTLQHSPVLTLLPGETIEVEESRDGEALFVPWQLVTDFSLSTRFDRHFTLDMASGAIRFGPSVRQPDGTVVQYGRIPESGRAVRISRYRYGGGLRGNLPVNSISTLTTSLAYISRAANLVRATGGRDQETIEEMKLRAQREIQAQRRAVTVQDFEQFTLSSSRSVARSRCLTPNEKPENPAGSVAILVVPAVADALKAGALRSLHVEETLLSEIRKYLDQYRLLTTTLHIHEPRYIGVKVKARVVPVDYTQDADVQRQVTDELNRYLSPLPLDERTPLLQAGEKWEGWPFGRDLFAAEVISLIQQVPLVKYVLDVEISSRPVVPVEEESDPEEAASAVLQKVDKVLEIGDDALLVSLEHEIEVVSLKDLYKKDKPA